jgi:hypothetical protein
MKKIKKKYPKWLKKLHTERKIDAVEAALDGKKPRTVWFRRIKAGHSWWK